MRAMAIDPKDRVFLDYGAGMGRVMVLAANYPFRRVLGVEISDELADIARRNLERCRSKLHCKNITVITGDASLYSPDSDTSVFYFNNPFSGKLLDSVLAKVQELAAQPRPLFLICNLPNSSAFESQVRKLSWLHLKEDFPLSVDRKCLIFGSAVMK